MPERRRPLLRILVALTLLVAVAVAATIYLKRTSVPRDLVLAGTLEARTVNVGSLVGGRVAQTLIDEGSHVAAGEVIVRLETETIDRQLAEQQAAIANANAELAKGIHGPRPTEISKAETLAANAEREERRLGALYHDGIVSKQMFDDAATQAKAATDDLRLLQQGTRPEDIAALRAQLDGAQRRLQTLGKQRAETDVRSSVDGTVQSFGLRVGDLVAADQPVAEILEPSQLWVRIYVPETQLGLVHVGQQVRVSVDTFPDRTFSGHIATIAGEGEYTPRNVQTRSQRAEEVFAAKVLVDPNPILKAGMAAEVNLGVKVKGE